MNESPPNKVSDKEAFNQLYPLIYEELHQLAARYMRREKRGHTLQTTALVNEAYCKLMNQKDFQWQNRAHFLGMAAQAMRQILVDHARKRIRLKRGGEIKRVSLDESALIAQPEMKELVSLDEALTRLTDFDSQKARIVEMKFFGGMSMEEIAEVEGLSKSTIEREWRKARMWLYREIQNDPAK